MKIWNGYGSEHSMNLVLIGKFKKVEDAEKIQTNIQKLSAQLMNDESHSVAFDPDPESQRFSDQMLSLMRNMNLYTLGPAEVGQLAYDHQLERTGDQITVKTDEIDVSAFVKLFVEAGAKVEIFSEHDYPPDAADAS